MAVRLFLRIVVANLVCLMFRIDLADAATSGQDVDLLALTSTSGFMMQGTSSTDRSSIVSNAGDVNNDGIDDILVSSFGASRAYVVFGNGTGIMPNINFATMVAGPSVGYRITKPGTAQCRINRAGDVNGDGIGDIIIGLYNEAYVIFGKDSQAPGAVVADIALATFSTSATTGFRISGGTYLGTNVGCAGDVNGDNIDDMLVTDHGARSQAGIVYVIFGRNVAGGTGVAPFSDMVASSFTGTYSRGFRILGAVGGDLLGAGSVSGAGDVNADSLHDVIVGAYQATANGFIRAGESYVIFGRHYSLGAVSYTDIDLSADDTSYFRIQGAAAYGNCGFSVGGAGDVNGDGVADMIVGAYGMAVAASPSRGSAGIVYVVFGRAGSGPDASTNIPLLNMDSGSSLGFRILGAYANDNTGRSVSGAGDVNGDGVADVIVGAHGGDPSVSGVARSNAGVAYVVFGRNMTGSAHPFGDVDLRTIVLGSTAGFRILGAAASDALGWWVSGGGDVNNDGYSDVIVGADRGAGAAYVIYGALSAPTSQPSTQPSGQPSGQPFARPSNQPSAQPSSTPSTQPSSSPSAQPTALPSCQPSTQPSGMPSRQPTNQPSDKPTLQPSSRPSAQPSVQPSSTPSQPSGQPSTQPSSVPSARPSSQPSSLPSCQPSSQPSPQPSSQPSARPSGQPSEQPMSVPSCQPSIQPSSRPSSQPSAQPSGQPTRVPSSQPSMQPSGQPTGRPSAQPSAQPSAMPTTQPSGRPTSMPSARPSGTQTAAASAPPTIQSSLQHSEAPSPYSSGRPTVAPNPSALSATPTLSSTLSSSLSTTREWSTTLSNTPLLGQLSVVDDQVWVCGGRTNSSRSTCVVLDSLTGRVTVSYEFSVWADITAPVFSPLLTGGSVVVTGRAGGVGSTMSEFGNCAVWATYLFCDVKSFADVRFVVTSYVPYPNRIVYIGMYNVYLSATIVDITTDTVRSFIYTLFNMKSVVLSQAQSPPSFIGSLVAGTGVRSAGSPVNCIIVGMLRTDNGVLSAMSVVPTSGDIVNSVDLVTSTSLEITGPDSFLVGALELSEGDGKHAYLLRANALYSTVQYCVRYRPADEVNSEHRRLSGASVVGAPNSVAKGVVYAQNNVFMIVDYMKHNTTKLVVLKVAASNGAIITQVAITAHNASLCGASITSTGSNVVIACSVVYPNTTQQAVVLSVGNELSFTVLPRGFTRDESALFYAETLPMKRTVVSVTTSSTKIAVTEYQFNTADQAPSRRPSVAPTSQPSSQPSSVPSTQPSSSPTSSPSVSARPTSQPSTASPTNTHKPSAVPTVAPTAAPTVARTVKPTTKPTVAPTVRPTATPSVVPTARPTPTPSLRPTWPPSATPTRLPRVSPSAAPVRVPSVPPTVAPTVEDNGGDNNRSTVIWSTVGGALLLCACGYLLYQYKVHTIEEEARAKRKVAFFAHQEVLVRALEKEREEMMEQIRLEDARKEKNRKKYRDNVIAAGIGAGAYATGNARPPSPLHKPSEAPAAEPPGACDVSRNFGSSSSVVLSSLHSSEMDYDEYMQCPESDDEEGSMGDEV